MKLVNSAIVFVYHGSVIHLLLENEIIAKKILPQELVSNIKINFLSYPIIIDLENGYSIHHIPNKTIIQINYPEEHNLNDINSPPDKLKDIADNLLNILKLDYKALGINFKVLIQTENSFPIYENLPQKSEIIELKYQIKKDIFLVINTLNCIIIKQKDIIKPGILFDSNFHLELKDEKDKNQIINNVLSQRANCINILKELINGSFAKKI